MLNIAICDDDIYLTGKIEKMILSLGRRKGIRLEVEVYSDGFDLINDVRRGERFDLIYLDIEMKNVNGVEAAREIRKIDVATLLVYITNHESYAKELFQMRTFEFIVKPIEEKVFESVFMRAYEEITSCDFYFEYRYDRIYCKVPVGDIKYFRSRKRTIYIVTSKETYTYYGKLNEIEKHFMDTKADFWRIHQSYLVNNRYIQKVCYDKVVLTDGKTLSISGVRHKEISERYRNRLEGE